MEYRYLRYHIVISEVPVDVYPILLHAVEIFPYHVQSRIAVLQCPVHSLLVQSHCAPPVRKPFKCRKVLTAHALFLGSFNKYFLPVLHDANIRKSDKNTKREVPPGSPLPIWIKTRKVYQLSVTLT